MLSFLLLLLLLPFFMNVNQYFQDHKNIPSYINQTKKIYLQNKKIDIVDYECNCNVDKKSTATDKLTSERRHLRHRSKQRETIQYRCSSSPDSEARSKITSLPYYVGDRFGSQSSEHQYTCLTYINCHQ